MCLEGVMTTTDFPLSVLNLEGQRIKCTGTCPALLKCKDMTYHNWATIVTSLYYLRRGYVKRASVSHHLVNPSYWIIKPQAMIASIQLELS
jgi:hypothetical protein